MRVGAYLSRRLGEVMSFLDPHVVGTSHDSIHTWQRHPVRLVVFTSFYLLGQV